MGELRHDNFISNEFNDYCTHAKSDIYNLGGLFSVFIGIWQCKCVCVCVCGEEGVA